MLAAKVMVVARNGSPRVSGRGEGAARARSPLHQQVSRAIDSRARRCVLQQGSEGMHRRHTKFIIVLLAIALAIFGLHAFGNWSPAYKPLLPPIYIILIGVAIWYS